MDRLCRICLASENTEIFRSLFLPNRDYAQKLFYLTNITVFEVSNKLPALICSRCVDNLSRACKIKKLALETDFFFKQITTKDDLKILNDITSGIDYKIIKQEHPAETKEVPDEVHELDHQDNDDDREFTLDEMIDFSLSNIKVEALEVDENFKLSLDFSEAKIKSNESKSPKDQKNAPKPKIQKDGTSPRKNRKRTSKIFACDFEGCTKAFTYPYKLRDHKKTHEGVEPNKKKVYNYKTKPGRKRECEFYVCDVEGCKKFYVRRHEFRDHKLTHTTERNFGCEICGKFFRAQHEVRSHIRSVHASKPHYCDLCEHVSYRKANINKHMEQKHLKIRKDRVVCHLCGKELSNRQTLKDHMLYSHGGEKNFKCHICGKAFFTKRKLTQHLDALHGERPWICEICAKTFSRRYKLGEHMKQTHKLGVKKFDCTLCGVQFDRIKALQGHLRDKHEVIVEEEENIE